MGLRLLDRLGGAGAWNFKGFLSGGHWNVVLRRMESFGHGEPFPVRPGLAQSRGGMG